MAALTDLPPEQRAVLSLVLERGRGYGQIATLLSIDESAVAARARGALESIGPQSGSLPAEHRRGQIADYLLGQQDPQESEQTRDYLRGSASGRAWARVVAAELRPIAPGALPEIPDESAKTPAAPAQTPPPLPSQAPHASRRGGAILLGLAAAAAVVAVVLVLVLGGGGSKHKRSAAHPTTTTQTRILAQVNLAAPSGAKRPLGVATLVQQGTAEGLALQAVSLAPTTSHTAYAVWLYNSHANAERIGFAPAVGKDGKLGAIAPVPTDIARFRAIIITRETNARGARPGPIVLSGAIPTGSTGR